MDDERGAPEEEGRAAPAEDSGEGSPRGPRGKGGRKPMSVRDAVGPPGLRGQRPRPSGGRTGTGRPDSRPPSARPTPVREAMEAPSLEEVLADPEELPSRTLVVDEERWIAREGGSTRGGHPNDSGAPLLQVVFYRESEPSVPVREGLLVGTSLEGLDDERLREGLRGSRPLPEGRRPGTGVSN